AAVLTLLTLQMLLPSAPVTHPPLSPYTTLFRSLPLIMMTPRVFAHSQGGARTAGSLIAAWLAPAGQLQVMAGAGRQPSPGADIDIGRAHVGTPPAGKTAMPTAASQNKDPHASRY